MFFENEADRLLKRLFSADPFLGMTAMGRGLCEDGSSCGSDHKEESDMFRVGGNDPNVRYYGFVMTTGPDGRPVVHEYGNARPGAGRRLQAGRLPESSAETREPLVDTIVDEKEKAVKLIAEMPGVEKRDIRISVEGRHVSVSADSRNGEGRKYQMRIPLERKVNENSAKATYRNGVLQITFNLVGGTQSGRNIRVD